MGKKIILPLSGTTLHSGDVIVSTSFTTSKVVGYQTSKFVIFLEGRSILREDGKVFAGDEIMEYLDFLFKERMISKL